MYCPKCGHPVEGTHKFCGKCGTPLQHHATQVTPTPPPYQNSQQKSAPRPSQPQGMNQPHPVYPSGGVQPNDMPSKKSNTAVILGIIAAAIIIGGGIVGYYFLTDNESKQSVEETTAEQFNEDGYNEYGRYVGGENEASVYKDDVGEYDIQEESVSPSRINGMTVRWKDVNGIQKNLISSMIADMVSVDGGRYYMGTNDYEAYADEKPSHSEYVEDFRINKYEVTQSLWEAVMGYNPSVCKGSNLPVENVSWQECQRFISELNNLTGLYFRLPTEAEWEYAARGGSRTNNYTYSGSNTASNVGWISENSGGKTHAVGLKNANELGLYDMTGNVWEWTSDRWSSDYNSPRTNENYVRRGGSISRPAKFARLTYRNRGDKVDNGQYYGLRLAM